MDNNLKEYGLAADKIIADANYSSSSVLESLIVRGSPAIFPIPEPINRNATGLPMTRKMTVTCAIREIL